MALQKLAPIFPRTCGSRARSRRCWWRPRWWPAAATTVNRIARSSRALPSAPCTNCGGSRATVTTEEPVGGPVTSVPSLVGPSVNSDVRFADAPSRGARVLQTPRRSSRRPSAKIGHEPEFDDSIPTAPGQTE